MFNPFQLDYIQSRRIEFKEGPIGFPYTFPTNKPQVFNEISIMENWLIIHVINSPTFLVLHSW